MVNAKARRFAILPILLICLGAALAAGLLPSRMAP
jgi:hypothetical protein